MRLVCLVLCIIYFQSVFANTLQDVIYKKDGSILRGVLVEQDLTNGRYKIRLEGGSVFSIGKDDIDKITKETPLGISPNSGVNININNSPSINQNSQVNPIKEKAINHSKGTIYLGTMAHTFKIVTLYGESEFSYTGLNLAAQINFNQHFALYTDFNFGSLDELTMTDNIGNASTFSGDDLEDETYTSAQISAILSTNLYQGWQFFTGLGAFTESYTTDDNSLNASGSNFQLGLGYSWRTLQVALRVNILNSSDYSEAVDSSTTGHLQLGFNF